jgi:ATP-dependent Clp protease ATP-binding subunit ClpC
MTKIPLSKLSSDDTKALVELDKILNDKVIGQEEAVSRITKSIRRNRLGIKDPNRPIGSFIFLGSTGVGKTYLAKQLAREVFGSEDALIRIDMSEFQEKHSVSRLIGAPPGYVGYDEGGQLTEQVKNKPYSVILFDEIEKANKDIFSSLLQVLDDGHMTDGLGRKINFKNCIIIMTSNLGVKKMADFGMGIGFSNSNNVFANEELRKETLKKELKKFFSPEFLNRIDDIIIFNGLKEIHVDRIVKIELEKLRSRLEGLKYNITFDESIQKMISKVGFDEMYGARPLKRAIQDKVEDYISEEVLKGNIKENTKYLIKTEDEETIVFSKVKRGN